MEPLTILIISVSIAVGIIIGGAMTFVIKRYIANEKLRKNIINDFVEKNKHLEMKDILNNFHKLYYSLDDKFTNAVPVDVMWQSILKKL